VHTEPAEPEIRTLTSSVIYTDNWTRLRRDDIERADGSRGTYAVIERDDFALIIPAENGGFYLVEEYRYLATELTQGEPDLEPEELGLRHAWVSRDEFEAMVRDGRIVDDTSLAAYALLLMAEREGEGEVSLP